MGLDPLALHTIRVSGMEHEKASQRIEELLKDNPITSSNSNGSSNPAVSENFFNEEEDDDAALEAIAAQSEASMSMMRNESINRPLHVQVNGFSTSQGSNSKPQSSSSSFAGSSGTTTPSTSYGQSRPSSLIRTPVMGPPVNSSTRSLLSPAGMIPGGHNDYSAQPSSFYGQSQVYRSRVQSMYQASSSNLRSPSGHNSPSTSYKSSTPMATYRYPPSTPSMAPPPRKDLEVSKRRICTDYVQIMREEEILKSLLPGMGDVTNNQIGMIMRRFYKSGLMCEDLPGQVRQTVFDDTSDRKIRAVASRQQQHPMDKSDTIEYKTDSSDDEEALMEPSSSRGALKKRMSDAGAVTSEEPAPKKINQATSRWLEEKCKFGRMANKCDFLIEEKFKERRRLVYELLYRTRTGRTWMEGEEPQRPREIRKRRNQDELLPVVHLHTGSFEGCARERPVAGFARRKFYKDPIKKGDGHDEVRQMLREPLKANELMKFRGEITFYDTANGTKETIPELIEVEDNVKGLNINTAAHVVYDLDDDTAQGVLTKENNFFTEQLLNYYHRLSTVPAMTLRTSPNRSTITATGEDEKMRSGLIKPQKTHTSKKISRRAERKSVVYDEVDGEELEEEVEEQEDAFASSDDDEWMVDHKPRPKKKAPKKVSNRPAKYNKKSTTNTAKPRVSTRNSTWRLDDFYMEDLGSMPPLPTKLTYARITVPTWEKVTVDWAADLPTTSGNDGVREEPRNPSVDIPSTSSADIPSTSSASAPSHHVDELTLTVARAHHALTFLEREKVKRSQENKQQKSEKSKIAALSKAAGASAASKPGQVSATSSHEDDVGILIDEKQLLEEMPPFRPQSMLEEKPKVMSRYASIAKPYTLREFDAPAKK